MHRMERERVELGGSWLQDLIHDLGRLRVVLFLSLTVLKLHNIIMHIR